MLDHAAGLSARAVGLVASRFAQVELIFPPLSPERLPEIDRLVQELIGRAPGLRVDGPHLNPEVASVDPAYLVAHLRAFSQLAPAAARRNGPAPARPDRLRHVLPARLPGAGRRSRLSPGPRPPDRRLSGRQPDPLPRARPAAPAHVPGASTGCGVGCGCRRSSRARCFTGGCRVRRPFAGVVADWNRWIAVERLARRLQARGRHRSYGLAATS